MLRKRYTEVSFRQFFKEGYLPSDSHTNTVISDRFATRQDGAENRDKAHSGKPAVIAFASFRRQNTETLTGEIGQEMMKCAFWTVNQVSTGRSGLSSVSTILFVSYELGINWKNEPDSISFFRVLKLKDRMAEADAKKDDQANTHAVEVDANKLIRKNGVLGFEKSSGFEDVTNFDIAVEGYVGDGGHVIAISYRWK